MKRWDHGNMNGRIRRSSLFLVTTVNYWLTLSTIDFLLSQFQNFCFTSPFSCLQLQFSFSQTHTAKVNCNSQSCNRKTKRIFLGPCSIFLYINKEKKKRRKWRNLGTRDKNKKQDIWKKILMGLRKSTSKNDILYKRVVLYSYVMSRL